MRLSAPANATKGLVRPLDVRFDCAEVLLDRAAGARAERVSVRTARQKPLWYILPKSHTTKRNFCSGEERAHERRDAVRDRRRRTRRAMLALLLARRGVPVTLLEMHKDFDREFRGDTVHPSTLEILDQLGLAEKVHKLPHSKVYGPSIMTSKGLFSPFDLRRLTRSSSGRWGRTSTT